MSDNEVLPPSKLGTKNYWESAYDQDLNNFTDHGDIGDVWFGEGIMRKMVNWLQRHVSYQDKILDVGCGNGATLLALHAQGFKNLKGVDYSEKAVDLARLVVAKHGASDITFETLDILNAESFNYDAAERGMFNAIVDKGTFDAICLNPDVPMKESSRKYMEFVKKNLALRGYFMITTCNFTKEELIEHLFNEESEFFRLEDEIPTTTMTFGGKRGNNVTCLIFHRLK